MNGGTIAVIIGAIVGLIGIFADPVHAVIVAHPAITAGLGGAGTIIAALLQPPAVKKP